MGMGQEWRTRQRDGEKFQSGLIHKEYADNSESLKGTIHQAASLAWQSRGPAERTNQLDTLHISTQGNLQIPGGDIRNKRGINGGPLVVYIKKNGPNLLKMCYDLKHIRLGKQKECSMQHSSHT